MEIRKLEMRDCKAYYAMQEALDQETRFMMFEPGERPVGEERFQAICERFDNSGSLKLVAEENEKIVGVLSAERGSFTRIHHTAHIAVGILEGYRNQGIGTRFFQELESWARGNKIVRLELTVMSHNERALTLYKKAGFQIEGKREKSMFVEQRYVDEYYMAKIL